MADGGPVPDKTFISTFTDADQDTEFLNNAEGLIRDDDLPGCEAADHAQGGVPANDDVEAGDLYEANAEFADEGPPIGCFNLCEVLITLLKRAAVGSGVRARIGWIASHDQLTLIARNRFANPLRPSNLFGRGLLERLRFGGGASLLSGGLELE